MHHSREANSNKHVSRIAVPSPQVAFADVDDDVDDDVDGANADPIMLFKRNRHKAHVCGDEEQGFPELTPLQQEGDHQSLTKADHAEHVLGSALKIAEARTGGSLLLQVGRVNAIELGRRVSSLSHGPPPQLLTSEDDGSVQTWASQITETTFLKVPKPQTEDGITAQESWDQILSGATSDLSSPPSSPPRLIEAPLEDDDDDDAVPAPVPTGSGAGSASHRKWDKLRDALDAEEKGRAAPPEIPPIVANAKAKGKAKTKKLSSKDASSPPRLKSLGKSFCKSIANLRKPRKNVSKGSVVTSAQESSDMSSKKLQEYNVKIRVEDLSKSTPGVAADALDTSVDHTVDADASLEHPENDPLEAESLEVVYVCTESSTGAVDVLPPFPTSMV